MKKIFYILFLSPVISYSQVTEFSGTFLRLTIQHSISSDNINSNTIVYYLDSSYTNLRINDIICDFLSNPQFLLNNIEHLPKIYIDEVSEINFYFSKPNRRYETNHQFVKYLLNKKSSNFSVYRKINIKDELNNWNIKYEYEIATYETKSHFAKHQVSLKANGCFKLTFSSYLHFSDTEKEEIIYFPILNPQL